MINSIKLDRAQGYNNGQPGGKEYWVIWRDGQKYYPAVTETLGAALEYIQSILKPEPYDWERNLKRKLMSNTTDKGDV